MSEIQSIEGRPIKKGISPGQRSAYTALALLVGAVAILIVGQLLQPPPLPLDHELALLRSSGAVELALPDGTAATPLSGSGVPSDGKAIRWAPGGDFLALRRRGEVVIVDRGGVVAWRSPLASAAGDIAWSPDGSRIAILDGTDGEAPGGQGPMVTNVSISIYTTTGALEWQLPLESGFQVVRDRAPLAWAPDGGTVAFTGSAETVADVASSALWLADIGEQSVRRLTDATDELVYGPAWTRGSGLLIGRMDAEASGILTLDPATGSATELLRRAPASCAADQIPCDPVPPSPLVPSPDGNLIAFRDPMFGLSVLNPSTREIIKIPQDEVVPDVPYGWSADGAFLYFEGRPAPTADPSKPGSLARFDVGARTVSLLLPDVVTFDLLAGPSSP